VFKEIFATMNDVLDEIIAEYPEASKDKAAQLDQQLLLLKTMNDNCLEEWMKFEERLSRLEKKLPLSAGSKPLPLPEPPSFGKAPFSEHFVKGQGYYKLYMFRQAVAEFTEVVRKYPDFVLGRVYLAMGFLRLGDMGEAYRQFQLLVPLTDNTKLKAISYSAMGCIQLHHHNMEKAFDYFKLADLTDSSCMEPSLWSKEFHPYRRT
jgi:tetratricopeptide (TPR) repeat protein